MKTKFHLLFSLQFLFSVFTNAQHLVQVWDAGNVFKTPESVLYENSLNAIFVANINGNPSEKDGNGFISLLNTDGTLKELKWIEGLNAPKGMAVIDNKLFVSDIDELVEIDIDRAKIINKYPVEGAQFLNDVTTCKSGKVFISDSNLGVIHVLNDGKINLFLDDPQLGSTNGLFAEKGKLFIGSHNIFQVDMTTKEIKIVQTNCKGIDGLEKDQNGNFVFSNWVGRIFYLDNDKMTKMVDSTAEKINTADIDFALELNLLIVPTFNDNRVVAYKIVK